MENIINTTLDKLKNSRGYFVKTLRIVYFGIRNNLVLAGILLFIACIVFPAAYLTMVTNWYPMEEIRKLHDGTEMFSILWAMGAGVLIPAVMFSFVHKRQTRDFYHSMPVRREQYFIGYTAAGFLLFLLPYLLMCVIMAILGDARVAFENGSGLMAFMWTGRTIVLFVIIYAAAVMSMMFSSSMFTSIVTFAFLNAFAFVTVFCSLEMNDYIDMSAYMSALMPYVIVFMPIGGAVSFADLLNQYNMEWVLWAQFGIALIELALAFIMYKYRRGETTMSLAFPRTRYTLQYGVMFLVAMFFVTFFNAILHRGFTPGRISLESIIWAVVFVFATFVMMNMILEKNFRAAFHKIRHFFIFSASYAVVLLIIFGIVSGLPRWVVPIKTDAVLLYVTHYELVHYPPGTDLAAWYGEDNTEGFYRYEDRDRETIVISDPKQVSDFLAWLTDYENGGETFEKYGYVDPYEEQVEEYQFRLDLITLKDGEKIQVGMSGNDIYKIIGNVYYEYNLSSSHSETVKYLEDTFGTYITDRIRYQWDERGGIVEEIAVG